MSRLKLLFVSHVVTLGGASRSLRELIRCYEDAEIDLAVPHFANIPTDAEIRDFFGPRLRRIFRFWLPWSEVYVGHPQVWQSARSHLLFPLAWRTQARRFAQFVQREHYDDVHLNSIVLHPMLTESLPMTLHVREILVEQHARVLADARRARGVVFIDEATKKPFEVSLPRKHIVLNNPIDMTAVGQMPKGVEGRLGGDPSKLTIFAIIGDVNDEKGATFISDAFRDVRSPDARLLLVGRALPAMREKLAAIGDPRVIYWGEERNIATIYTLADYVMRGEAYPCVGRTIYEALYAGAGVIVPGKQAGNQMFEYERFADRIRFYAPRDRTAFVECCNELAGTKRTDKRGESNVERYVGEFDRFLRDAIG